MSCERFFWWLLTMTCVAWYSTITIYVAIRGAADIKEMLIRLGDIADHDSAEKGGGTP
jgi:hypothetical protein